MITKKQITETYKGKKFGDSKWADEVKTIVFHEDLAILLSGHYDPWGGGYDVEAVIDRNTGENLIPGQSRPCDDKSDAIDVACEMMA